MNYLCVYRSRSSSLLVDSVGLISVIVLALFVRFHAISVPSIWYDEAFSLLLAKESPWQIWSITARDVHPPLYYVLLHYWMLLFGNSVVSVRSLSALADVGTLLLCVKLMSLVATRKATWIAALLLALLPISVRYSQEVRMYTLVSFWLMGATVALVCWVKAPDKKRFPTLYVLLMTAAFYTHYFAALCVLVHWLFWWRARGVPIRAWMLVNIAIAVLYLPWVPHFIGQLLQRNGLDWIPPLTWQAVLTVVWQFTVMIDSVPAASWWRVVPTLLIFVCAASVLLNDRSERRYRLLLVGYFFVPVLTVFLMSLVKSIFVHRYLMFAAVGLPMICAVALDSWWQRRPLFAAATVVLLVIGQIQGLQMVYRQTDGLNGTSLRKELRLDALANEIDRQAHPGDKIVLDTLLFYLPFTYYNTTGIQPRFHIKSSVDTFPDELDRGGYALIPQHLKWIFFNDVSQLKLNGGRVWWITDIPATESHVLFADEWKQTLTIKGEGIEARLFTLDAAPAPLVSVRTHPSARQYNPLPGSH
ncbi:glycosyltransferase family 39 protein [Pseudomonas sp. F01002]|uniref:glycosyltransferase family 39 protein n=1 Tax=Pseudomonas sp. F01002 TaxID=2555724 RepID=UPI00106AB829|nr:glycosyltransferase family 39 protein [Pseudomonas sp. F01002]TFB45002.1 hypothetical protein E3W21_01420 [Pseudomonas sp. F01002]